METEIITTIQETFHMKTGAISLKTPLEEIATDSMDIIELIAVLSNKYKLSLQPGDMNNIKTIGDIVTFIMKQKGSDVTTGSLSSF